MRFQPFRIVTQCTAFSQVVVHTVAFDVGFIVHIQSVFVAQFIEAAVLRIMAQTYGIEVVALHQFEILAHQLFVDIVSRQRVVLVDVDSFQFDRLSVDHQNGVIVAVC